MPAPTIYPQAFSQRLLLERVRAVLRRAEGKHTPAAAGAEAPKTEALVRGKLALDPQRHECTWDGKPVRLTVTEFLYSSGAGAASRLCQKPRQPDGRGL